MRGDPATNSFSEDDIERLSEFLDRGGPATLDVQSVDGLFAALVCSPVLLMPSQWMPLVWGGPAPRWETMEEVQEFTGLIMRLWNSVAHTINDGTYVPILGLVEDETGQDWYLPYAWCRGFMIGMAQHMDLWLDDTNLELGNLLQPIRTLLLELAGVVEAAKKGTPPDLSRESLQRLNQLVDEIPDTVVAAREYWIDHPPERRPSTRSTPKIGRNDPCPCGSGKKFKHCHGATGESLH
jgi:uncharacterized protein